MATDRSKYNMGMGPSIIDQYKNAETGIEKGSAVMSGIATGLSGAADIAGSALKSAQINDTAAYQNQINDLSRVGMFGYGSYDQWQRDYNDTDFNVPISYKDIRGMNGMQKAGAIGSSTLSGAMTGFQIGGPWGAIVGGAVGLGAGIGGVVAGDVKARTQKNFLGSQLDVAEDTAIANRGVAGDYLGDRGARWRETHLSKYGGPIRTQSIQEFADRILGTKTGHQPRITKTYCKGGLKISIK